MSNERALAGRTAVVTGASSGSGRAIAEKLGAAGAHVHLAGRSAAPMEASQKRIEASGGRATVVPLDVREVGALQRLVADAVLNAVTQPSHVNVEQIVVRPPKQLQL